MKKSLGALTFITLALFASLIFGLTGRYSASAKSKLSSTPTSIPSAAITTQTNSITLPNTNIYALNNNNTIFVLTPGSTTFTRLGRVTPRQIKGILIGIDFRVADGNLYGLTNTGNICTINLTTTPLSATLVSTLTPRFAGGFQSLFDFNPVLNAIRIIGSNDQNFAVVNANGGNLNQTVVQTKLAYAAGDVNAGVDPNISAGAYTNNFVGAANTLFYGIDYDLNTFVTIATKNATGSSNTGGGQLQTIGQIVDTSGNPISFSPTVDIDIYTDANGVNSVIGVNDQTIFTIDLSQINSSLALGTTQNVVARTVTMAEPGGGFIDIAVVLSLPKTPSAF